jgi:hypothetical protein
MRPRNHADSLTYLNSPGLKNNWVAMEGGVMAATAVLPTRELVLRAKNVGGSPRVEVEVEFRTLRSSALLNHTSARLGVCPSNQMDPRI